MKRWKKVVLVVLAVLVVGIGGLAVWQWKNLKAVHSALTTDKDTLAQNVQDKADEHREALESSGITVTPPSVQQNEDLLDGKVSADEVKEALGIVTLPVQAGQQDSTPAPEQSDSPDAPAGVSAEELLNQCVAELYACQVELMARLGQMKQAAIDQWTALPPEERTALKKQEIGMAGLQQCYALEVETDAAVKDILARCRTELEKLGADTGTLDLLWTYYCEEKEAQKAFYLNKYLK